MGFVVVVFLCVLVCLVGFFVVVGFFGGCL